MAETENRRKPIFALDIGTRSVIGLTGYGEDDHFYVQYVEREEYNTRAVVDGQIENIGETAKVVNLVKERLEKKMGTTLKTVYIAAAGRVLRTVQASFIQELDETESISARMVSDMELGAVQVAYEQIFANEKEAEEEQTAFYCVGHAVQKYTLDGYDMSSLVDHKGHIAQAHIIATFLPRAVVESLYSTMGRCGLAVAGLTLEPIAAMNAIIPSDLRRLNLALVDIGAGTSDIALCDGGSVTAYTMATIAGDEITEALMNACLVDFATAEDIKQHFAGAAEDIIHYIDILGQPHDAKRSEMLALIQPVIEQLAQTIGEKILEAGGHAPAAVFLAGGGSQIVGLAPLVAKQLGLDSNRVAVGGALNMKRNISSEEDVYGPEFATPTGIALTAIRQSESDTFTVTVNGQQLHLLRSWDTSVLSILQMAGYRYSEIMPRTGQPLHCTVNGEHKVVRGGLPEHTEIYINGQQVSLMEMVHPGDDVVFKAAESGEPARATVADLLENMDSFEIYLDGEPYPAGDVVTVNGMSADANTLIEPDAVITVNRIGTVGMFCAQMDIDLNTIQVSCNGIQANSATILQANDRLEIMSAAADQAETPEEKAPETKTEPKAEPAVDTVPVQRTPEELENVSKEESAPQETAEILPEEPEEMLPDDAAVEETDMRIKQRTPLHLTLNKEKITLQPKPDKAPYQFFDLLPLTDIDPEKPQGIIVQKRNGKPASYLEILKENDTIEIYWERK